jgi:hypothetical protein
LGSVLIGLSLFSLREFSFAFRPGTTTDNHPVALLIALLLFAGAVWIGILWLLRRHVSAKTKDNTYSKTLIWSAVFIGLAFRALFIGSTPIYEDDWNRYLWDGAVIAQGFSPYLYSPDQIANAYTADNAAKNDTIKGALKDLSEENDDFIDRINNPHLTTIYPPVSQLAFALSAMIKPFDIDVLRLVYLMSEFMALLLLVRALTQFGQSPYWVWLYALNPLLIFTAFNGLHMDILLVPFILGAIVLVNSRPLLAGVCLAAAAAIKLWPLIVGPILFRSYRVQFLRYAGYGLFLGLLSFLLCLPMLLHLGEASGLNAYSATWQRSSFLFPYLETLLSHFSERGPILARSLVALSITAIALYFGLIAKVEASNLPLALLIVTLALYWLSPTGFPWYIIWFAFLIPFVPTYGAALLCVTVSLYYARFWLGEAGHYDIYLNILVPLQFCLPLIVVALELILKRHNATNQHEDSPVLAKS